VTLIEMLIALTLLGLVSALALGLLLRQHWTSEAQGQRAALQSTIRAASIFLSSELRELGGTPGDPDLLAFAPESLTYRAARSAGISCARSVGTVMVARGDLSGYRLPQAGRDSLLLWYEGSPADPTDDRWIRLPILSVGGGSCGRPADLLGTAIDTLATPLSGFPPLAPVRTFEVMQVRLYSSSGDYWLGARSVSGQELIQPFAGPFPVHGVTLSYFDSLGLPATSASSVRAIDLRLRGLSSSPIRTGAGMGLPQRIADSLFTRLTLRNW
jgi:type II secretory pathway pseudopilin PulG